jgi:hypothetical protein
MTKATKKMHRAEKQARLRDIMIIYRSTEDVIGSYRKAETQRDAFKKSDVAGFIADPQVVKDMWQFPLDDRACGAGRRTCYICVI